MSLDLRGYNTDEALVELDQFLDKALVNGLDNFKIITGKGILAKVVSDYLVNYFLNGRANGPSTVSAVPERSY